MALSPDFFATKHFSLTNVGAAPARTPYFPEGGFTEPTMLLLVFVTDDGTGTGASPTLFIPAVPNAEIPPHPRGLEWRYFATIGEDDKLLDAAARDGIEIDGFYLRSGPI
jgi:hypothetical protein